MTVSTTVNRASYTGNGSTATYPYPFKIFLSSDLSVYIDGVLKVLTTDYTVTGVGNVAGGNVVLVAGNLANGKVLLIVRVLPETQLVDYVPNDSFPADTHEGALDRLTMLIQQIHDLIANIPRITAGGTTIVSGDFILSGWGAGATITAIHGSDMAHRFTITAGTAPSSSPTIQFTFHDGTWTQAPVIHTAITGGNGAVTDLSIVKTATTYTLTYQGLPVATKTYVFDVICIGVLN